MKNEKVFQTKFNQWIKSPLAKQFWLENDCPCAFFELKCKEGGSLSWSDFRQKSKHILNQLEMLGLISKTGVAYKIPDDSYAQKPFDCGFFHGPTWVVVLFRKKTNSDRFYMIASWYLQKMFTSNKQQTIREEELQDKMDTNRGIIMQFSLKPQIKV